ncbi:MAG TPA: hypothetical protein VFD43_03025 [Planctomycetota bacterium]|nr:hypothetical protein [Planctomycetota bacterium]
MRGLLKGLLTVAGVAGITGALPAQVNVSGNITTSTTWTANNYYNLQGQVYVTNSATLTIEPGVVIASQDGGSLAVCRDSKIYALGEQDNPIIFTSDNELAFWAVDGSHPTGKNPKTGSVRVANSEWGNLTMMGNGFISENDAALIPPNDPFPDATNRANMEGLTAGPSTDQYGGGDDDDNSGTIRYVSLRYAGKVVSLQNELNGLSLGGIGRETDIHHVEIFCNVDDGVEIWGGAVNLKYFSIWNIGDDSFDVDQGWRGKAQFGLIVQGHSGTGATNTQGSGIGDNCFETDGAEQSDYQPVTTATIYNCTVIGQPQDAGGDHATAWRDNARVQYRNCIFMDIGDKVVQFDNSDGDGAAGYGFGGTLSWADTWTTDWSVTSTVNPGTIPPGDLYKAQTSGKLAEIKDSVFFNNNHGSVYTEASARGVFDPANNNVLEPAMSPITSISRSGIVVVNGIPLEPVTSLDPRPANDALTAVANAANDGFFTPAKYRGAFAPGQSWLSDWTATSAYGVTSVDSPWTDLGDSLPGTVTGRAHPLLVGSGPLTAGSAGALTLTNARPSSLAVMFVSTTNSNAPFKGGILHPVPVVSSIILFTSAAGSVNLAWPSFPNVFGIPLYFQYAISDTDAINDVALSNALKADQP